MKGGENVTEFEQVYRLYFHDVYKYALSLSRDEHMAEEITQETFFKALESLDRFDGRCKVYVWLCQIAKNTYFTMRKREQRTTLFSSEETDGWSDGALLGMQVAGGQSVGIQSTGGESIEQKLIEEESSMEIHRVLHRLPEPYKEVFSLRTFGELSFKQIGDLFGKTESWARVTYHRAKMQLKEELS